MGAQAVRSLRNHNIAHPEHPGRDAFHVQSLTVSYEREHAAAARLKPDLMTAREQSPAQLLELRRIVPIFNRGTQGFSPPHYGPEQIGSGSRAATPPSLQAAPVPDPRTGTDRGE